MEQPTAGAGPQDAGQGAVAQATDPATSPAPEAGETTAAEGQGQPTETEPEAAPDPRAGLPLYTSHKVVGAFRIKEVAKPAEDSGAAPGSLVLIPEPEPAGPQPAPVVVGSAYVHKHEPKAGGWYVRYADGYESWSPDRAFREGYTRTDSPGASAPSAG